MKKQTAVEWLQKAIMGMDIKMDIPKLFLLLELFKQANQQERQQIIQAHYDGGLSFQNEFQQKNAEVPYINEAEQYYNETYLP